MAPGIVALHKELAREHEVLVVAPETEQSAVGHAITLVNPIRIREHVKNGMSGYAITGTPADCVKLALGELMPKPPDMVLSGINLGANVGINLLYSGTVSAATEASLYGIPALAVSLDTFQEPDFGPAARAAADFAAKIPGLGIPPEVPLNMNVPALPEGEIKGLRFTRQSRAKIKERFIRRTDPRGHVYYWQAGESMGTQGGLDTDYPALLGGYITVTPIHTDLTQGEVLKILASSQTISDKS